MAPRYPLQGDGVPRWVLTMEWRGRRLAWTSDGATVAGLDYFIVGSVEVDDVADALDLNGADVREPLSVALPWLEGEQPKDLQDRPVVLALVPSSGWDNRYTMLVGRVTRTQLDRPGALVGIEVSPEDFAGKTWPPATWAVTPQSMPRVQNTEALNAYPAWFRPTLEGYGIIFDDGPRDSEYGKAYPVLYGHSADYDRVELLLDPFASVDVRLYVPTAKCPVIDDEGTVDAPVATKVLVGAGIVPAESIVLFSKYTDGAVELVNNIGQIDAGHIIHGVDALGQSYTAVDVDQAQHSTSARKGEYFVATKDNAAPTATAGAGHLAVWLLSQVGAVDLTWCGDATARSEGLPLGGYIDEPVEPLAWVQDNVTGRLPLATTRAPSGQLRLTWVPYQGGAAVASLTDGARGVYRAGEVTEAGERTAREVEVRYRYDVARERYREMLTVRSGPTTNKMARHTIEVDNVHATTTAGVVANYALWRGRYRRDVRLDVAVDTWGWLRPGQLVRYTDADLGVSDRLYLVQSIARTDRPYAALALTPIDTDTL